MQAPTFRILVVDDFEPWRRFVCATLRRMPEFQVVGQASDGLEAVRKAQELQPDLVLLDIGLPKLHGLEVVLQIRKCAPFSKILFVSLNHSWDIVEEALRRGGNGYVLKSDAAGELLPAVRAVLGGERFVSASLAAHDLTGSRDRREEEHRRRKQDSGLLPPQNIEFARRHEVEFYADDAGFVEGFTRFIRASLQTGKAVIVIATEIHRLALSRSLRTAGVDLARFIEHRAYIPLDVAEVLATFMVNGLPDPVRFLRVTGELISGAAQAATAEGCRVAACGECAPFLLMHGNAEAAIQLEHLWDKVGVSDNVDILCGYGLNALTEHKHDFPAICAEHSAVRGLELDS